MTHSKISQNGIRTIPTLRKHIKGMTAFEASKYLLTIDKKVDRALITARGQKLKKLEKLEVWINGKIDYLYLKCSMNEKEILMNL